jgi:serine/threonine protein kinase/CheY-like chemotaxis protein
LATILVIDDDPDALLLVSFALEKAGHRVVTSSDPHQIGKLVEANAADAVVLDVLMPGLSGHEALRALRDRPRTGGVPVLLLSARAEGQDRVFGLRQGADDFLSKPFEPEELILRIERLIATRNRPSDIGGSNLEKSLQAGKVLGPLFLGRYQALEVIGEGGSGFVFRGWDPWLKRPVALKTLRFEPRDKGGVSRGTVEDLVREAVTVARFSHPNIVTVYDAASDSQVAFIAMEFVDGPSLARYLDRRGKLPPEQVVQLGVGIARGLAAAHAHDIVHHDVKPGNILLGRDGSIKVSDFGIARLLTSLGDDQEQIFGTPGYMPPELLLGQPYERTGDLFGLGVIFFELLTGTMPFAADHIKKVLLNTLHSYTPRPRDLEPQTPLELDELVRELLEKDPAKRLADAAVVADRLLELQEGPWRPDPAELQAVKNEAGDETPAAMSMSVSRSELLAG